MDKAQARSIVGAAVCLIATATASAQPTWSIVESKSPTDDSSQVSAGMVVGDIGVAAHELVHATVGTAAGHRKPFKQCALAIGLKGPMTATSESEEFMAWVNDVVVPKIGPYPAGKITWQHKKQTTRLVKCECTTCQYPVRTTRLWIDSHGAPHCPSHGAMMVCE